MRNYKKETQWDAQKYKRLTFKVDRPTWQALTQSQQTQCKSEVREVIRKYVDGGNENAE